MMLKVGDVVRILDEDSIRANWDDESFGMHSVCGLGFTDSMFEYCGRQAIVTNIFEDPDECYANPYDGYYEFSINIARESTHFNEAMIEMDTKTVAEPIDVELLLQAILS